MNKLSVPNVNNKLLFDAIVSHKNLDARAKLSAISQSVKERYDIYQTNINNLQPTPDKWRDIEDQLRSCYSNNVELNSVKERIFNALPETTRSKCPYCMINRHNTMDHYFDKSNYPEFSVFIPNLIPCCSECNTNKGTELYCQDGERLFIHYYYDEIPSYQFLYFNLSFNSNYIPIIQLYLKFQEVNDVEKVITHHFGALDLRGKYTKCITEKLSSIIIEIKEQCNDFTVEEIKKILTIRWKSRCRSFGKNYWESALYEGVINSENFVEAILSIDETCI